MCIVILKVIIYEEKDEKEYKIDSYDYPVVNWYD